MKLFDEATNMLHANFAVSETVKIGSITIHIGPEGCVILRNDELVVETPYAQWHGPVDVKILKNGELKVVKAVRVHHNPNIHEEFKFIEPVGGGLIVLKAKDNVFIAELMYDYCYHSGYHVVCKNSKGKEGVLNCYTLVENDKNVKAAIKVPFEYYHVRLGSRTIGLQKDKRKPMVFTDFENVPLSNRCLWGAANSVQEAINEVGDIGTILRVVPSDEFPGLYGLFSNEQKKVVIDGKKDFIDKQHYFLVIEPDKEDGSKGRAIAYNKDTLMPLPV